VIGPVYGAVGQNTAYPEGKAVPLSFATLTSHYPLMSKPSTILLAVTGLSPAIVTETVWALAREKPRVIPRRVVFITTQVGAQRIQEQLFTPLAGLGGVTAWQALRTALQAEADELIAEPARIIGRVDKKKGTLEPLPDIVTPEHNDIAAGFILEQVRGIVENPDTPLIASIAGGRKTMGALLHSAVTLIGRETDRLTHVLVSAPFETLPGFFFPAQPGGTLPDRDGKRHDPRKAGIHLADVPFVPLRNRFADLSETPGSFGGMVQKFSRTMREDAARPRLIELHYRRKTLSVDGEAVRVPVKALAVLHFLLACQERGKSPLDQKSAATRMTRWLEKADFIPPGHRPKTITEDEIRHCLNDLRVALKKTGWAIPARSLTAPPFQLRLAESG